MISIGLPSIFPTCLERALLNIRDATCGPHEVIVVSPFEPKHHLDHVVWLKEELGTGTGCNAAHAKTWPLMKGDFCMPWVDDHLYVDGWDVMAVRDYEATEPEDRTTPYMMGLRHLWPLHVGTLFGRYYPYFPFARRSRLKEVGWFDPVYEKGFADGDLAMRVYAAGGQCQWSEHGLIIVHPDDNRKGGAVTAPTDMPNFVARWAERFGAGWDVSSLRGFNIDIEPQMLPELVTGRTVCHPASDYRAICVAGGWRNFG